MKALLTLILVGMIVFFSSTSWVCGQNSPMPDRKRLVLIGDSTVKCGRGLGEDGLWGWGQVLGQHVDHAKITIENRALGGRSSRTYWTEGLWERSLRRLRKGDFLLMQFGHNDNGEMFEGDRPRASIKGNGDETVEGTVATTGKQEVVHSYGWYLRQYIAGAQAKGAIPIVLSLVPRDRWADGRVIRSSNDFTRWAREAAEQSGAHFIDFNDLVAQRYETMGQERVGWELFKHDDWTHTIKAGAEVNAAVLAEGIRALDDCSLKDYLRDDYPNEQHRWRFDFGEGDPAEGFQAVNPATLYTPARGYGWEPGPHLRSIDTSDGDALTSDEAMPFSVAVPEGNYHIRLRSPSPNLTVKAEVRRWMAGPLLTQDLAPGDHTFVVNVRRPDLPDGERVRLKPRERSSEKWSWDERLTLEFLGENPAISMMEITPMPHLPTLFLAGDSTVADQAPEPWNSWGQMLTRFIGPEIAIANHAESGESIRSSLGARRFDKIFSLIRSGDYLFFQFGHNDMKDTAEDALDTYRKNLTALIERTRKANAHPVLVTSMERKRSPIEDTHGAYPDTVRRIAQDLEVSLLDLHAMSKTLYTALGDRLEDAFQDATHHNNYGSALLALCLVQAIREELPNLASWIAGDVPEFDPRNPPSAHEMAIPTSPARIPRDPSFTPQSAYAKEKTRFPDIALVTATGSDGVQWQRGLVYKEIPGTSYGDRSLRLDLVLPKVAKPDGHPAVILVHGGGWRAGSKANLFPLAERLAEAGYAAVPVEYRLSMEAPYPAAVEDLHDALHWLRGPAMDGLIDPDKIAILGCSAGAQLATLIGVKGDVQAVINIDGIVSFIHPEAAPEWKGASANAWLGARDEHLERWKEASPLEHVSAHAAPTLFINSAIPRFHAGRDDFMAALKAHGIMTESHTFEDSPHPFWLFEPWFEPTVEKTKAFLERTMH